MQAARQREVHIRVHKGTHFAGFATCFTSAVTAGGDCFVSSITLRSISIAYENVPSVRSNARRCGCANCFDLGPNPECVARGNSFASPNRGIAKPTRDCNGEPIRYSIFNYAWRGDPEFVDEKRPWRKS
jgi:hypothetical protein